MHRLGFTRQAGIRSAAAATVCAPLAIGRGDAHGGIAVGLTGVAAARRLSGAVLGRLPPDEMLGIVLLVGAALVMAR